MNLYKNVRRMFSILLKETIYFGGWWAITSPLNAVDDYFGLDFTPYRAFLFDKHYVYITLALAFVGGFGLFALDEWIEGRLKRLDLPIMRMVKLA